MHIIEMSNFCKSVLLSTHPYPSLLLNIRHFTTDGGTSFRRGENHWILWKAAFSSLSFYLSLVWIPGGCQVDKTTSALTKCLSLSHQMCEGVQTASVFLPSIKWVWHHCWWLLPEPLPWSLFCLVLLKKFSIIKITHYYLTGSAVELVMKHVSGLEMWL